MHFLRTGKTTTRKGKHYVGQSDVPLCDEGINELLKMKEEYVYPPAELVFTSPLTRCAQTAGILYPDTRAVEIDGLMDMNLGEFEGKSFEELRGDADFSRWISDSLNNTPPGGEELTVFIERIVAATRDIFIRMMDKKITDVAVITHVGVIMTLLAAIGLPKMPLHEWTVENGSGYTLLFTPQMWMRDGAAEAFCRQPGKREWPEDELDD